MPPNPIHLLTYQDQQLIPRPLPLDEPGSGCTVTLRKLPGARQVRVVLCAGDVTLFRAEVLTPDGTPQITLDIRHGEEGHFELECREGASVRYLQTNPAHAQYEQPIEWLEPAQDIDLAIVVDATTRLFLPQEEPPHKLVPSLLLAKMNREHWSAYVDKLCKFTETLRAGCANLRVTVLAFGDQAMPDNVTADDLRPAFKLYPFKPEQRLLQAVEADALKGRLLAIPHSSGGDFVDALADALAVCNNGLHWSANPGTRKLVLICGESPGFSITHQLPKGDACVREHDVDTEALRLFRQKRVTLLSLYYQQPADYLESLILKDAKELQEAARSQYLRLATVPSFAFADSQFDGAEEAETVLGFTGLLGYGGCCGEWVA
ncbi:hypothetical protein [Methylovulum psychrotolerans]|uniref:VWFA domain-containing protein n=1 Tax=Methylovulum psychrotolerans TaxID=1704499 RepID=A0A1Z4C270_9GAMM|nr:hypothetical protein [Methylovulum psychrotolerans]ASF47636.1 hypothetical protein CEK71_17060 [Methylovulum psychrotolerans]